MFSDSSIEEGKPKNKKQETEKDIEYEPPPIPENLIEEQILNSDEITNVKQILNKKKIDSDKCYALVQKITDYYPITNSENPFLFYLSYLIISYLCALKQKGNEIKKKFYKSFKLLIDRTDVQIIIFTKPDILYRFYSIIFNLLNCEEYIKRFNEISSNLDKQIRPNVSIFWNKFYNFLNANVVPNYSLLTSFRGDRYLKNASDKLKFFALMGIKSFAQPHDYSYFYELIFLYIIKYPQEQISFYAYLMKGNPQGSIDNLVEYIIQNVTNISDDEKILIDQNFAKNILNIFKTFPKHKSFPDRDYLRYLTKACIPLVSNEEMFGDKAGEFDELLLYTVKKLHRSAQKKFFYKLLNCYPKDRKKKSLNLGKFKFDSSLCPPMERGIHFFKLSKSSIHQSTIQNLIIALLKDIEYANLQPLRPLIEAFLEMYPDKSIEFISLLSEFYANEEWIEKFKKKIQIKQNTEIGKDLDNYIKYLIQESPSSEEKSDAQLQLQLEISNKEKFITYDLIFLNQKGVVKRNITLSDRTSIKSALKEIALIGIYPEKQQQSNDDDDNNNNENSNTNKVTEINVDDEPDDSYYHTMKLGRDSHFCKEGVLFGHEKSPANKAIREPAEIFGLSDYVDRSLPFNSLSFPNNTLYVRLKPVNFCKVLSVSISKALKVKLQLPKLNEQIQPDVVNSTIKLPPSEVKEDKTPFDELTSNDMCRIFRITGHPPTTDDAQKYVDLGKDIDKFKSEILDQHI